MQKSGRVEDERLFDDIREMMEKCFSGEGVRHLKAVERAKGEEIEMDFDHTEYEALRQAYEREEFPDEEEYPVDLFCDTVEKKAVKIRENSAFYEVLLYEDLNCIMTFNALYFYLAIPKHGCEVMVKVEGRFELAIFWDINTLTEIYDRFRFFFVEVLERMGEYYYIYRDIARSFSKYGFLLTHEPISKMKKYRTPDEMVRGLTSTELNVNFNKRELNYSIVIAAISRDIIVSDWGILCNYPEDEIMRDQDFRMAYSLVTTFFLISFYKKRFGNEFVFENWDRVKRYRGKVSLRIPSVESFIEYVEGIPQIGRITMSLRYMMSPDIPDELTGDSSVFKKLKDELPQNFEWITSLKRLQAEGMEQHNCVYTYWSTVRVDRCAIFHWEGAARYTIEVQVNEEGYFYVEQMKGPCNSEPEKVDEEYVTELIGKIQAYEVPEKVNG